MKGRLITIKSIGARQGMMIIACTFYTLLSKKVILL